MARPDRRPVLDALDVVPHPVAVDQPRAGGLGDADHPAIDMFGHAGDHVLRRLAEPLRPVLPHQIVIAADAAGGDDHRLGAQREVADDLARAALAALDRARARGSTPLTPSTAPLVMVERIDAVAEPEASAGRSSALAAPAARTARRCRGRCPR